jgi:hypothetical protein
MGPRFTDGAEAGRLLGRQLGEYAGRDDVGVLGLPRGGVPGAFEIARRLAFGAIITGGMRVLNKAVLERLTVPAEWIEAIDAKERREPERRERLYRGDPPPPDLADRVAILVEDGLATGAPRFLLDRSSLHGRRLERAIGVVYRPGTERTSHYFRARIAEQFDAIVHIDRTTALARLERSSEWVRGELPETHPTGV